MDEMSNFPPPHNRIPKFNDAATLLPMVGRGGIVAYIARWSAEDPIPNPVIHIGVRGIGFADEMFTDRDKQGVLWTRAPSHPGVGRPRFDKAHPLRQRRAMRKLLCQVCAQPADVDERGALWLLPDHRGDWPNWPENMANMHPPLCLPCARASAFACPALRRGYVAVRAQSEVAGVYGLRYEPGYPYASPAEDVTVGYDDPMIRWTRAAQLVRTLHGCEFVELDRAAA